MSIRINNDSFGIDNKQYVMYHSDGLIKTTDCTAPFQVSHITSTCVPDRVVTAFIFTVCIVEQFYTIIVKKHTRRCSEWYSVFLYVDLVLLFIIFKDHTSKSKRYISLLLANIQRIHLLKVYLTNFIIAQGTALVNSNQQSLAIALSPVYDVAMRFRQTYVSHRQQGD